MLVVAICHRVIGSEGQAGGATEGVVRSGEGGHGGLPARYLVGEQSGVGVGVKVGADARGDGAGDTPEAVVAEGNIRGDIVVRYGGEVVGGVVGVISCQVARPGA